MAEFDGAAPARCDGMIKNFQEHAANERTFLAWVRTAIAVMAFGFLVEKFDVFLELAIPSLPRRSLSMLGQTFGNIAGLALIVVGTGMVVVAAIRRDTSTAMTFMPAPARASISRLPLSSFF